LSLSLHFVDVDDFESAYNKGERRVKLTFSESGAIPRRELARNSPKALSSFAG